MAVRRLPPTDKRRIGVKRGQTFIPRAFNGPYKEEFDTEYMRQLFAVGCEMAAKGYPWQKVPPGFLPEE